MFRWLLRKRRATEAVDFTSRITALQARIAALEEDRDDVARRTDRCLQRIYAVLGRRGIKVAEESNVSDEFDWRTAPLDDPRLSKAQVKHRLSLQTPSGVAGYIKKQSH